jgi:hypothetical protein
MNAIEKKIQYANELTYGGYLKPLQGEMKILIGWTSPFTPLVNQSFKMLLENYKKKEIGKDINK